MRLSNSFSICSLLLSAYFVSIFIFFPHATTALDGVPLRDGPTVKKDERWPLVSTEFGEVSAVKISINDGKNGCYYLHFITLYPRALFLPVYLHTEMILYVNTGNGTLSWMNDDKDKIQQMMLHKGDVFRLSSETVFYIQNTAPQSYDYQAQNLQIYAIFPGSEFELQTEQQLAGVYTPVNDLVLGFDDLVLQSTFSAPQEAIEELRAGGERLPLIVDGQQQANTSMWDGSWGIRGLLESKNKDIFSLRNKMKAYNIFREDHDVETYFGWSVTVTAKESDVLKHTDLGVFMVYLNKGAMMGPHWNPSTDEVAIALQGEGMIQVVCPGLASETGCKNSRFKVEEGDVFVVPRSHPMTQISFNNNSFVFMGFKLATKDEKPQYLTGKYSFLQRLDTSVLQKSFNVQNTTIDWIFSAKREKIISECISCSEEEVAKAEEEGRSPGGGGGGGGILPPEEARGREGWQEGAGGRRRWGRAAEEARGGWQEPQVGPSIGSIHVY